VETRELHVYSITRKRLGERSTKQRSNINVKKLLILDPQEILRKFIKILGREVEKSRKKKSEFNRQNQRINRGLVEERQKVQ
jgi:hypothetical protein